jgi:NadR type nicotinamide-nucleotide adenylyltransferase
MRKIVKIAVTGPESTGKSMISEQLANHYHTIWVPEFARFYLNKLEQPYDYGDILEIAKGQVKSAQALLKLANKLIFSDTELLVTKIWCDVKYRKCHPWILENLEKQDYDLYLLMNTDIPWQNDPMREHPEMRDELFRLFKNELEIHNLNYWIVSGLGEERLKNAISLVDELLITKLKYPII